MKLLKKILSRKGFSYVLASVLMVVIMLICVAICEIIRINIQARAVRDKFEDAIIAMCVDNYSQMYQTVREGYAASYGYNGSHWLENNAASETYIRKYLSDAMSAGEIMQCDITSLDYVVDSAELAPKSTAQEYSIAGNIVIKIPYRFAWSELAPISMKLDVKSKWRAVF